MNEDPDDGEWETQRRGKKNKAKNKPPPLETFSGTSNQRTTLTSNGQKSSQGRENTGGQRGSQRRPPGVQVAATANQKKTTDVKRGRNKDGTSIRNAANNISLPASAKTNQKGTSPTPEWPNISSGTGMNNKTVISETNGRSVAYIEQFSGTMLNGNTSSTNNSGPWAQTKGGGRLSKIATSDSNGNLLISTQGDTSLLNDLNHEQAFTDGFNMAKSNATISTSSSLGCSSASKNNKECPPPGTYSPMQSMPTTPSRLSDTLETNSKQTNDRIQQEEMRSEKMKSTNELVSLNLGTEDVLEAKLKGLALTETTDSVKIFPCSYPRSEHEICPTNVEKANKGMLSAWYRL